MSPLHGWEDEERIQSKGESAALRSENERLKAEVSRLRRMLSDVRHSASHIESVCEVLDEDA